MRVLKFACVVLCLAACGSQESSLEKLQGHWHAENPSDFTLDISGDSVIVNKYTQVGSTQSLSLFDSVGRVVLPMTCHGSERFFPAISSFRVEDDTLVYDDDLQNTCFVARPLKFRKSDPIKCGADHAFTNLGQVLELNNFPEATSKTLTWQVVQKKYNAVVMILGLPLNPAQYGPDARIQASDVFIEPEDISIFLERERDRGKVDRKLVVCISAESSVPDSFQSQVLDHIPDSVAVYNLVRTTDGQLAYQLSIR